MIEIRKTSFFKQSFSTSFFHIVNLSCTLLLQIIISRVFGPEGRGIYANIFAMYGMLVLYLDTGHGVANTYFIASGKQKAEQASGSTLVGLAISAILLVISIFLIYLFRDKILAGSINLLFIVVSAVPFIWLATDLSGILRGLGRADLAYCYYGIQSLSRLCFILFFCVILKFQKLEFVFAASIFSAVVSISVQIFFLRKQFNRTWLKPDFLAFKQSMSYSLRFYFGRIANPMQIRPEMIIIPIIFANIASLGFYAQGIAILDRILLVAAIVGYVLTPMVADASKKSAILTARVCRVVFFVTFVLGISLMSCAKFLIPAVFGAEFSASVPLMWMMLPGLIFRSVARVIYHYFQGIGKPGVISMVFLASIFIMLLVDILLIPRIGIMGAAIGTLISCLFEFSAFVILFALDTKISIWDIMLVRKEDIILIKNKLTK